MFTMKVLIVEDDPSVSEYIRKGLQEHGHTADTALDGREGLFLATTENYDVLILDMMLPKVEGLTILNTLRASDIQTPTLILSAKTKVEDKVKGLRSGADDYLSKPFAFEELLARVEVLHHRNHGSEERITQLTSYDLEMDLLSRQVTRAGKPIDLQAREFKLLEYLLRHKGQVVTRTMLL